MAFRWRAVDGPLIVLFRSFLPSSSLKKLKKRLKLSAQVQNYQPIEKFTENMSCTPEGKLRLEKISTYGFAKKAYEGGDSVVVDFLFIVTPIVGVCNCSMFC